MATGGSGPAPQCAGTFRLPLMVNVKKKPYLDYHHRKVYSCLQAELDPLFKHFQNNGLSFVKPIAIDLKADKKTTIWITFKVDNLKELEDFRECSKDTPHNKLSKDFGMFLNGIYLGYQIAALDPICPFTINLSKDIQKKVMKNLEPCTKESPSEQEHRFTTTDYRSTEKGYVVQHQLTREEVKKFIIHMPRTKEKDVKGVYLEINGKEHQMERLQSSNYIYMCEVRVPEGNGQLQYRYRTVYSYGRSFWHPMGKDEDVLTPDIKMREQHVHRDFFTYNQFELKAHIEQILNANQIHGDKKEICMEIESVCNQNIKFWNKSGMIEDLFTSVDAKKNTNYFTIAIVIGNICTASEIYGLYLTQRYAQAVVDQLSALSLADFTASCSKYMPAVCHRLYKIAFPTKYSCVSEVKFFTNFLGDLKYVCIDTSCYITSYNDTPDDFVGLCFELVSSHEKNNKYLTYLERLLKYASLSMTIAFMNKWQSELDPNLESRIQESFHKSIENDISIALKGYSIERLYSCWNMICQNKKAKDVFHCRIERHVIELLPRVTTVNETTKELLKNLNGLFEGALMQEKLVKSLAESNGRCVRLLFTFLHTAAKFEETYATLDVETYLMWLDKSKTRSYTKGMLIDDVIELMKLTEGRTDVQDAIGHYFFTNVEGSAKELMSTWKSYEEKFRKHQHAGDLFVRRLLEAFRKDNRCHPVELLQAMTRSGRDLEVNSRWSVRIISTILDVFCPLKEHESYLSTLPDIMQHIKVWQIIVNGTGDHHRYLKDDPTCAVAYSFFIHIAKMVNAESLSFCFSQKVLKYENKDIQILNIILQRFSSAGKVCFESASKRTLKLFHAQKQKLQCVINVLKHILDKSDEDSFPCCFYDVLLTKEEQMRSLHEVELSDENCLALWAGTGSLYSLCSKLETATKSQVFWNVYKADPHNAIFTDPDAALLTLTIHTLFTKSLEEMDGSIDTGFRDVNLFLKSVFDVGICNYEAAWIALRDSKTLLIGNIKDIFRNASDDDSLEEEKKMGEATLNMSLQDTVETLRRLTDIPGIKKDSNTLDLAVKAFDLDSEDFQHRIDVFAVLSSADLDSLLFHEVKHQLKFLFELKEHITCETFEILNKIGSAQNLLAFMKEIVDEDIRNLIDAVDDISEQYVREATVSGLIDVKSFLQPLIQGEYKNAEDFLKAVETRKHSFGEKSKDIPFKLNECRENLHQLKALYKNVANRGEQTKETIKKILSEGFFTVSLSNDTHNAFIKCVCKEDKSIHVESTLVDLRSRALLLMNSERARDDKVCSGEDLNRFIMNVDQSLEIKMLVKDLYYSGHENYETFEITELGDDLLDVKKKLESDLKLWEEHMNQCQKDHFLLNFVQGIQLHSFFQYIKSDNLEQKVDMMLKFIHPEFSIKEWKGHYDTFELSEASDSLHRLGRSLDMSFDRKRFCKQQKINVEVKTKRVVRESVQKGRLLLANLDENSVNVVKTVLALYENTTKSLPEPYQVLFCCKDTTWDEIKLLINRCLYSKKFFDLDMLYCLANVELLPNEMQFKLVEALHFLPKSSEYLLSVVCRGGKNHLFIDEFADYVTTVLPSSDSNTENIFRMKYPDVMTVSSDIAGLGKSTHIKSLCCSRKECLVTLHISGDMNKKELVEYLNQLHLRPYHALHLDIADVDDIISLDTFLFELVFLRYVKTGSESYHLTNKSIYLEVANTVNSQLRNSLQTAMCFHRENLKWERFSNFVVSRELNSPIQVVCVYLEALEKGTLDKTDIILTGKEAHHVLPGDRCKALLAKYVTLNEDLSFVTVNSFLKVLAEQLKKMSCSSFFKTSQIKDMTGNKATIKSALVEALTNVSKEFAIRSIKACKETQLSTISSTETALESSVESMIRWEDSNHLIYVFHSQNIQTLSAMYREKAKVPEHVKSLFESQMKKSLEDFKQMNQDQLQVILQKVSRTNPLMLKSDLLKELSDEYALTPDNLLKMVLIIMRIRARVQVVVMGETGCGKTSLIRYLANVCEVPFDVLNIHAGTNITEIIYKIRENDSSASACLTKERWLFLDEINTSENLNLMSDVICHHTLYGKKLSPNLVILSACNPYKLRSEEAICTAGLKAKVKTDEMSKLVYRVLPLPQQLVDFVWDFGSLSKQDEYVYIHRMVHDVFPGDDHLHSILVDLLAMSQEFIRNVETSYNVSLRDVQRCRTLTKWFCTLLRTKETDDVEFKAIILAVAHCYFSRLISRDKRKTFREHMQAVFQRHDETIPSDEIHRIIMEEQRDILRRMELPPGTAQNQSLQENVFMILVCILNKIPIFVVGKPGCSKSLAMQVIRSNLRGKDSKDDFFKKLPQIYCVSFQGSESSTSEGILKVFEKAENYQKSNREEDVMSVVILDEVGLAEVSRFNPLKVLHSLLEPGDSSFPNIAVVGISNWALDASKMNRAIHLSRPDMDAEELHETGVSISESFESTDSGQRNMIKKEEVSFSTDDIKPLLRYMADAYFEYSTNLVFENFHGLRDYYALVKYVANKVASSKTDSSEETIVQRGLERNFGGLPSEMSKLYGTFKRNIEFTVKPRPVTEVIAENFNDGAARHLLLITSGQSILGILEQRLVESGRSRYEVIFGSQFEEDLTDDYNYRMLSRIILCMEEGIVLILKDLDTIYGSLYDMLNQNYTIIGKTKNCRVALGHYSNPICRVADTFRCIVLVDETKVNYQDPPFLNRFEKQMLRFSDILEHHQEDVIRKIDEWINCLSDIKDERFNKSDLFPIYSKDLLASLVLKLDSCNLDETDRKDKLVEMCKSELIWIMKSDAILRLSKIKDTDMFREAESIKESYFEKPIHGGLLEFYDWDLRNCGQANLMRIIFTYTSVHTNALRLLKSDQIQTEYVGAFKSEKQLSSRMNQFWMESDASLLCMQCSVKDDGKHVMLVMSTIERYRTEFMEKYPNERKHVYLILHMSRLKETSLAVSHINFLSSWHLTTIDCLDSPLIKLPELCESSLLDRLDTMRPLNDQITQQLFWVFTRIKYSLNGRNIESIHQIIDKMKSSEEILHTLDDCLWSLITHSQVDLTEWQIQVACDRQMLNSSTGMVDALEMYLQNQIRTPLARVIYHMEEHGVLDSFLVEDIDTLTRRCLWKEILQDENVFNIKDVPVESGPESYVCNTSDLSFKTPFFKHIYEYVEGTKGEFIKLISLLKERFDYEEDEPLPDEMVKEVILAQQHSIISPLPKIKPEYTNLCSDYVDDFCNILSASSVGAAGKNRIPIARQLVLQRTNLDFDDFFQTMLNLHSTVWLHPHVLSTEMQILDICSEIIHLDLPESCHIEGQVGGPPEETPINDEPQIATVVEEPNTEDESYVSSEIDQSKEVETTEMSESIHSISTANKDSLHEPESVTFIEEEPHTDDKLVVSLGMDNSAEDTTQEMRETVISKCVESSTDDELDVSSETDTTKEDKTPEMNSSNTSFDDSRHETRSETAIGEKQNTDDDLDVSFEMKDLKKDETPESSIIVHSRNTIYEDLHHSEIPLRDDSAIFGSEFSFANVICKKLLPTAENISAFSDIRRWGYVTGRVLPLVPVVSNEPISLDMLRYCHDIFESLIQPHKVETELLIKLAEEFHKFESFLEESTFICVMNIVHSATGATKSELQRVISDFLLKYLFNHPSENCMGHFYNLILGSELPDNTCTYLKFPVSEAIDNEMRNIEDEKEGNFLQLVLVEELGSDDSLLSFPFIDSLNNFLGDLFNQNRMSDPFIILLTDIFEDKYRIYLEDLSEQDASSNFLTAHKLIRRHPPLNIAFIASVGCYKAFIKIALSKADSKAYNDAISTIFTQGPELETLFFFNWLHGKHTSKRLTHVLTQLQTTVPSLKNIPLSDEFVGKCFDNSPLTNSVHGYDFSEGSVEETDKTLIEKATTCEGMLAVYHIILKFFYIPRSYRALDDSMTCRAEFIMETAKENLFSSQHLNLMSRLLGRCEFGEPMLMHTPESKSRLCLINTTLATLYSMLLANDKDGHHSLFQMCLLEPCRIASMFLPCFPGDKETSEQRAEIFVSCTCGYRLCLSQKSAMECLICKKTLDVQYKSNPSKEKIGQGIGWTNLEEMKRYYFSQRSLSPVACSMILLFLKGCLLGSFAIGIAELEEMESILNVSEIDIKTSVFNVEDHWNNLLQLLNLEDYSLFVYLQSFIQHQQSIFCTGIIPLQSVTQRIQWEEAFSKAETDMTKNRFDKIARAITDHAQQNALLNHGFEMHIGEYDVLEDGEELLAICRMSGKASRQNFLAELFLHTDQFPILDLIIQEENNIKAVNSLYAIIQWHLMVVSDTSYLFKKREFVNMTVTDFVHYKDDKKHQDLLRDRFQALCDALQIECLPESLKQIQWTSKMSECLILDEHSQLYLGLQLLTKIQNDIIETAMCKAADCKSLHHFLRSADQVAVPEVQVMQITEKMLVRFNQDIDIIILQESQCDPRYGHGRQIIYDFEEIEKTLLASVITGKVYIRLDFNLLPKIVFSDELYRNISLLIQDIRENISQESLTGDMAKSVRDRHEKNPKMISELLKHIGMLLPLLKKTRGDPEETVAEYVENWKKLLATRFPIELLPRESLKLCYIVALYELLEELNADLVIDGLGTDYRMHLQTSEAEQLNKRVKEQGPIAEVLLKALKRFIHRSLDNREADIKNPLQWYMSDSSLWPSDSFSEGTINAGKDKCEVSVILPEAIMVGHTCRVLDIMKEVIETKRQGRLQVDVIADKLTRTVVNQPSRVEDRKKKNLKAKRNR